VNAITVWQTSIRDIRNRATTARDAVYNEWLSSNMLCDERDRRMAFVSAIEDNEVKDLQDLYRAMRASEDPTT
jgi:hypothetical protein